jgi:hypothetical protein
LIAVYFLLNLNKFSSAGAAMGAAATANVGSLAAAGGAALSAGVGAAASAVSALLPSGDAPRETGAIPKRKVSCKFIDLMLIEGFQNCFKNFD